MSPELLLIGTPERTARAAAGRAAATLAALPVDSAGPLALGGYRAAVCLTEPGQSPWGAATMLYLAGVPHRIGRSGEFGGSLLSRCLAPEADDAALMAALDAALDGTAAA